MYRSVKRLGIPDSNIILMLADDMARAREHSQRGRAVTCACASARCAHARDSVCSAQACNPRNPHPGVVFNDAQHGINLCVPARHAVLCFKSASHLHSQRSCAALLAHASYGQTIEVDYRGYDVTVENFLRILTGECTAASSHVPPLTHTRPLARAPRGLGAPHEAPVERRAQQRVGIHDRPWG